MKRRMFIALAGALTAAVLPIRGLAQGKGTIAIITPSHDNPFFKAEADGADGAGARNSATRPSC